MKNREALKELGQMLAKRRRERGLTQVEVAEYMGIEKETVSRIENGAISPTLQRLRQLAAVLGCSLSDLFRTEEGRDDQVVEDLADMVRNLSQDDRQLVLRFVSEVIKIIEAKESDRLHDQDADSGNS